MSELVLIGSEKILLDDIRNLIETAKNQVYTTVNSTLVMLNWSIGLRINNEILNNSRAEYGAEIINKLSEKLLIEYGKGYSKDNLFRMIRFIKAFPNQEIVATMSQKLSWSKWVEILLLKDPLQRDFYTQLCHLENWSVRVLRKKIQGMLFERTALSKNSDDIIKQELEQIRRTGEITPSIVFRDPYFIDFLNLPAQYTESDLENAILEEITSFIQELGNDFCFLARQKRITIGGEDYYIDALFFHRGLRRLICLELKLGKFTASNKGQMELYLRWLDKYERKKGEEAPLGIILCSEKNQEQVELLEMNKSGIHVAEYLTQLPPKKLLEKKLNQAIKNAQERLSFQELSFSKDEYV